MPRFQTAILMLLLVGLVTAPLAGRAGARALHPREKVPKTHRILANSKSVRINDAGEVITTRKP